MGCGGGGTNTTTIGATDNSVTNNQTSTLLSYSPPHPAIIAPEEADALYIGYFLEDNINNPEDPTPGSVYFSVPPSDTHVMGSMSFTYDNCQTSSSVGTLTLNKLDNHLSGSWSGTIDATQQTGSYNLIKDSATSIYTGTYINDGGKQLINNPTCTYYLAANGVSEVFPLNTTTPATANSVNYANREINWPNIPEATRHLVSIINYNSLLINKNQNAIVWQGTAITNSLVLPSSVNLLTNGSYIISVVSFDSSQHRIYFSSKEFLID